MKSLRTLLEMIKFEHTVFALPFAYLGMVFAWQIWENANWSDLLWITVAMAAARTAAMSLNRYIDQRVDVGNPRTAGRPLISGKIAPETVLFFAVLSLIILAVAAWNLSPLAFKLFPGAVIFLVGYAYTKRFTWLCHYVLGFTDALAPMGGWVAVRGTAFTADDLPAWLLLAAVTVWIGGFDIIYASQDIEFDRANGLHSIPARFGIPAALRVAAASHVIMMMILVLLGFMAELGWPYWLGLPFVAVLLYYEHSLVRPDDLSKLNVAFFNINGYISILIFVAAAAGLLLRS